MTPGSDVPAATEHQRPGTAGLHPVLGIAADVGFLASLVLVLTGFGALGLWCGLVLGAISVAGVATNAVLHLQRPAGSPAVSVLALVAIRADDGQRAA
jgi:hypothetical protein